MTKEDIIEGDSLPLSFTNIKDALAAAFDIEDIKFKPQAMNKEKTSALATAHCDSRAYQNRLDEVCPDDWSCETTLQQSANSVMAMTKVTICGITRGSTGEEKLTDMNPATSAEAQAFKRACSFFGLGRFLYALGDLGWHDCHQYKGFPDAAKKKMLAKVAAKIGQTAPKSAPKQEQAPQDTPEPEKPQEKRPQPPPNEPAKSYKGFKVEWGKDKKPIYEPSHLRGEKKGKIGVSVSQGNWLDNLWRLENVDMGRILHENKVSTIAELPYDIGKKWLDKLKDKTYSKDYIISETEDEDLGIDEDVLKPEDDTPPHKGGAGFGKIDTTNPNWTAANRRLRAIVKKCFEVDDDDHYKKFTQGGCSTSEMTADAINALATEISDGFYDTNGKYIGPSYDD